MTDEERKEKNRARYKAYREANKEKRKEQQRAYYEANKEKRKEQARAYYEANKEKHKKQQRAYREANKLATLVNAARLRAEQKNLPFDLDQHMEALQARYNKGTCELTGLPFETSNGRGKHLSPMACSIDRINPDKGYTYDNVRLICFSMNAALNIWGEDNLETIMRAWLKQRDNTPPTHDGNHNS